MTEVDEARFSDALLAAVPQVRFVDGQRWPSVDPPVVPSINSATSTEVFIWSPVVAPRLPSRVRPDGVVEGPASGPVIQFRRSAWRDGELRSGRIAAGWDPDDPEISGFVRTVWKVMKRITTSDLETYLGHRFSYRIGSDAKQWFLSSSGHRLRDQAVTSAYFRIRET
jgi:hypothetical protein